MATISENLVALNEAKQSIKSAIESKGQDLTGVPFTEYGGKIEAIQTGGKELPSNFIMTSLPNGLVPTTTFVSSKGELFASNANTGLWYYDKTAEQWINSFEYTGSYGSVPFWEDSNGNIFTRPANNHLNHIRLFDFETKRKIL